MYGLECQYVYEEDGGGYWELYHWCYGVMVLMLVVSIRDEYYWRICCLFVDRLDHYFCCCSRVIRNTYVHAA